MSRWSTFRLSKCACPVNFYVSKHMCGRYQKRGKNHCYRNPIGEDQLKSQILDELRQLAKASVDVGAMDQEIREISARERQNHERAEADLRASIAKLHKPIQENWTRAKLSRDACGVMYISI